MIRSEKYNDLSLLQSSKYNDHLVTNHMIQDNDRNIMCFDEQDCIFDSPSNNEFNTDTSTDSNGVDDAIDAKKGNDNGGQKWLHLLRNKHYYNHMLC